MTPEEQLLDLIQRGVGQAVINSFCRANGLHIPGPDPVRIVVAVSAPRLRRRSSRKATTTKKTATPTTSSARASKVQNFDMETRFDLKD